LACKAHQRIVRHQMRTKAWMLVHIVSALTGKRRRISDFLSNEFEQPTTAAGIRDYMRQKVAGKVSQ